MHAHDRTLLSQLGFSDPDKRSPLHDLACRYLALPENRLKIMSLLPPVIEWRSEGRRIEASEKPSVFEKMISKGEGKYRTTIGFVDLVIPYQFSYPCGPGCCYDNDKSRPPHTYPLSLGIEVKITPIGIGEILRQINLYREHVVTELGWMVATAFPLPSAEVAILKGEKIRHVRLGDGFQDWASAQQEVSDASDSPEI